MPISGELYYDLGPDHFGRGAKARQTSRLVARLQNLGYAVEITPLPRRDRGFVSFFLVPHRRRRPAGDETGAKSMVTWHGAFGTEVGLSLVRKARVPVGPGAPEHPRLSPRVGNGREHAC